MARLTTKRRKHLPKSSFGLPGAKGKAGKGKYPMPDKAHARNAKARASQMYNAGKLSASQKATIDAKANRKLGHSGEKEMKHYAKSRGY